MFPNPMKVPFVLLTAQLRPTTGPSIVLLFMFSGHASKAGVVELESTCEG